MGHSRWEKEAKKIQWRFQQAEQVDCEGKEQVCWSSDGAVTQRSKKVHDILVSK